MIRRTQAVQRGRVAWVNKSVEKEEINGWWWDIGDLERQDTRAELDPEAAVAQVLDKALPGVVLPDEQKNADFNAALYPAVMVAEGMLFKAAAVVAADAATEKEWRSQQRSCVDIFDGVKGLLTKDSAQITPRLTLCQSWQKIWQQVCV